MPRNLPNFLTHGALTQIPSESMRRVY